MVAEFRETADKKNHPSVKGPPPPLPPPPEEEGEKGPASRFRGGARRLLGGNTGREGHVRWAHLSLIYV
jgi:hypothetical protein